MLGPLLDYLSKSKAMCHLPKAFLLSIKESAWCGDYFGAIEGGDGASERMDKDQIRGRDQGRFRVRFTVKGKDKRRSMGSKQT